jgi:hypothetical protein
LWSELIVRYRRQRRCAKDAGKLLAACLLQSQRRAAKIACRQISGGLTSGKPSRDRTAGSLPLNLRRDIRRKFSAKQRKRVLRTLGLGFLVSRHLNAEGLKKLGTGKLITLRFQFTGPWCQLFRFSDRRSKIESRRFSGFPGLFSG